MAEAAFNRRSRSKLLAYVIPIASVAVALAVGAIMLVLLGANPLEGFRAMLRGAFGSTDALISTALKATPLMFVGVGVTIAFRANVINIGGEGQMVAGGLLSTVAALSLPDLPSWVVLPGVLLAGVLGRAIWGFIPGAPKAYFGVNEILSTIMLNVVAVQLMNFLLLRELAEVISGLRPAVDGSILIDGTDVTNGTPAELRRAGLAYVPEGRMKNGCIGEFTVSENLLLIDHRDPRYVKRGLFDFGAIKEQCRRLVDEYAVKTPTLETTARSLSGGNIQKLILAREISGTPKVLIASQPTRGVDIGAAEYIHKRLVEQRAENTAILVISADLDEIFALSDRIAVIYEGRIVGTVEPAETTREQVGLMMAGVRREAA